MRVMAWASAAHWIVRNVTVAQRVSPVPALQVPGAAELRIRGCRGADLGTIRRFLYELQQPQFARSTSAVVRLAGRRTVLVLADRNGRIVGLNVYYFNEVDLREGTIHEGFIGVAREFQGRGLAGTLRGAAIEHFRVNGLAGISSRISTTNHGSMRSALRLGFRPVFEYFDPEMQEQRQYLVLRWPSGGRSRDVAEQPDE